MTKIQHRREALMYEYRVSCCDDFTFPGLPRASGPHPEKRKPPKYVCRRCGKEMKLEIRQLRTEEEADLIIKNNGNFHEKCADCGMESGHHVVWNENDGAYFLMCGNRDCGSELREVEKKELAK